MAAATALLGWLLSMKTDRRVSVVLALIFLLDPMFVQNYRGARIDCWALTFCIGGCWLVRYAMARMQAGRPFRSAVTSAGVLVATSFFIWPSVAVTYPLVIAELFLLLRTQYAMRLSVTDIVRSVAAFAGGGLAATAMLLIPVWHLVDDFFNDIRPVLKASQPAYQFQNQIQSLFNSFKLSQVLPISILVAFVYARGKSLACATTIAIAYLCSTWVYLNRLIYLLPYAIGLIASAYQTPVALRWKARHFILNTALAILVVVSITLSLIVRPAIALSQQESRDPSALFQLGRDSIGTGPHRVYVDAWEFYFVGRELGWRMFNEYVDADQISFSRLLETVDYAILAKGSVGAAFETRLAKAGLSFQKELPVKRQQTIGFTQLSNLGAKPYGPYLLYSRRATSP